MSARIPPHRRRPSWGLCRQLAGAEPDGNVGDLADVIAQFFENAEAAPADRCSDPPTLNEAKTAVAKIRSVLEAVELRLNKVG